jgi:hypothetical protein
MKGIKENIYKYSRNIFTFMPAFFFISVCGAPPSEIPPEQYSDFTLLGQIPVVPYYFNDTYPPTSPRVYSKESIEQNFEKVSRKHLNYYGTTDRDLYAAIEHHIGSIKGKEVAIMGSNTSWYESIVLYYGGIPTTIDYNKIVSLDPRLKTLTVEEYEQNPTLFDAVISISSYEHDGLGRYGDPINPNGDFAAMEKTKNMLVENGLLFLAVPIGQDCLCWNAHRIYGPIRWPLLINGWETVSAFGFDPIDFNRPLTAFEQPVFVLKVAENVRD